MSNVLSPYDLLQVAREIELNGEVFYHKAAEKAPDNTSKGFLAKLAEAERRHGQFFKELQQGLSETSAKSAAFRSTPETEKHLKVFAAGHIFDLSEDPAVFFLSDPRLPEMLRKAMRIEKDTIVFYLGFRDMLVSTEATENLNRVIGEELNHLYMLSGYLQML